MGDEEYTKPSADISMVTDYDQRYLGIISKIFKTNLEGWEGSAETLDDHLQKGGKIAAFWHKMNLVGAIVWKTNDDTTLITQICFKKKAQRQGFGKELFAYALHKIAEDENAPKTITVTPTPQTANFFKKCSFTEQEL